MIKSHYSRHITADKLVSTFFKQVLFHEDGSVKGIATNDVGIGKDGSPKVCHHHKIVRQYPLQSRIYKYPKYTKQDTPFMRFSKTVH